MGDHTEVGKDDRGEDVRIDHDPSTGRPILVAPRRRNRPLHTQGKASGPCPFCPGEEHQTPPEVDAIRAGDSAADAPGWNVRAFANLYPAATLHDVVVEGAAHEIWPARVAASTWQNALTVYRRRMATFEAEPEVRCSFWFKNVGRDAGASIAHSHSQILGLPMLPPRLELELAAADRHGCVHCHDLVTARAEGRVVFEGEHHIAVCPRVPKLPHETWVLPRAHAAQFLDDDTERSADLSRVLSAVFCGVDGGLDQPAFNVYLHRVPGADFHWHFELQPRTGFLAGLELGGDMYINSIRSDEAAAKFRPHARVVSD